MNNVSKTLYIPLYGKAFVSRKGIILSDPKAETIWAAEGFPLRGKAKSKWLAYYMGMRSAVFDRWVQAQMEQHSGALVIHIGCGMDSRVQRVDGSVSGYQWFDVDFPEGIEERKRYYQESDSYHMLAGDARETGWLAALPEANTAIVVMEGLSMYLKLEELTRLLAALRKRFANLHVLLDCYTSFGAKASKYKNPINSVGVTQTYGMDDPMALAEGAGLRFVREHMMTPEDLIGQLNGLEQGIFRKLFAGGFAGKIYRMYEFHAQSKPHPEAIAKQAAEDLAAVESLTKANRYLDGLIQQHEGFLKVANNLYRCGDVLFNTGLRFTMESHARGLEAAKHWEFASAPKLLAYIRLTNGNDCVLITRIEGISESMPLPCTGANWQMVTPEGCKQLMADAEKLRERSMINEAILTTHHWHVVPSSGMIVISNWSRVRQCASEEEGWRMMENVKRELSDRGLM